MKSSFQIQPENVNSCKKKYLGLVNTINGVMNHKFLKVLQSPAKFVMTNIQCLNGMSIIFNNIIRHVK